MTAHSKPLSSRSEPPLPRMCSPDLRPPLQTLLATLADMDFAYESDIETIRDSSAEEWLKQAAIRRLQQQHRERRETCVRQLKALQGRTRALAP